MDAIRSYRISIFHVPYGCLDFKFKVVAYREMFHFYLGYVFLASIYVFCKVGRRKFLPSSFLSVFSFFAWYLSERNAFLIMEEGFD